MQQRNPVQMFVTLLRSTNTVVPVTTGLAGYVCITLHPRRIRLNLVAMEKQVFSNIISVLVRARVCVRACVGLCVYVCVCARARV